MLLRITPLFIAILAGIVPLRAHSEDAQVFFEKKVRPLLVERCLSCHGAEKQKGKLRLDSIDAALKGGETGPALVKQKPTESLLVKAIEYGDPDLQMPPKAKLPDAEIAILKDWIAQGAVWPENAGKLIARKQKVIGAEDQAWWSFQPLSHPAIPDARFNDWCRTPIDRFIAKKLSDEGLTPAPEADKRALIRRVTFDLHGLPPTPEETDAFVNDATPDAYEKLLDRLLASPRYGERWAQHWLDLTRYAESDGFRQDAFRPHVWPYRDYVIRSFNQDKPYDRFVQEQLAGDEIAPDDPTVFVATAFLRNGLYEYNQVDVPRQWSEMLTDVTDTTADVFLGLSMGCARCHDHKFDPILQADYFRLQAFFAGMYPRSDGVLATSKERAAHETALKVWEKKTESIRTRMAQLEKPIREKTIKEALNRFIPEYQALYTKPVSEEAPLERQYRELVLRQVVDRQQNIDGKIKGKERDEWTKLKRDLAEFDSIQPKPLPVGFITTDIGTEAPPITIPGDATKTEQKPDTLTVLKQPATSALGQCGFTTELQIQNFPDSTGRRLALAKWLTQPEHPLTTRVIVNRIWQYHFGKGLTGTSSDYGRLGEKPSHPELLDWLAREFVSHSWSFKYLHRLIMTSATYRQSALQKFSESAKLKDPEDRWLWRFPTHRLQAEQIRDAALSISGELDEKMGGPPVDSGTPRRTIYNKLIRNTRDPLIESFDAPDTFGSAASRNTTTTSTQSLMMINGNWTQQRAEYFANRLQKTGGSAEERVILAYRLAFGRAPNATELKTALAFVNQESKEAAEPAATTSDVAETRPMPIRGGQALFVGEANPSQMLRVTTPEPALPVENFTLEAIVQLESIYDDASVRVILSQWNGDQKKPGWSLGVTSQKSKHEPRNIILQLVTDPAAGGTGYEVIPSDLRVELHKPYYLAAIVNTKDSKTTFYLKDLSDNEAVLRTAEVPCKAHVPITSSFPLMVGGREPNGNAAAHGWDGLIDDVRITSTVLAKEGLMVQDAEPNAMLQAEYHFESEPGPLKDSSKLHRDLVRVAAPQGAAKVSAPVIKKASKTWIDFCHVLLNASEFLYVD